VLSAGDETLESFCFGLKRISYSDITYGGGQVVVMVVLEEEGRCREFELEIG
jgi:hypothetical protein